LVNKPSTEARGSTIADSRGKIRRLAGGFAGFRRGLFVTAALALLVLAGTPAAGADSVLELRASAGAGARAAFGGLSAVRTQAGAGICLSNATGAVPFAAGSARGSISVVEPHRCAGGTKLTFPPPLRFANGLLVAVGHVLTARVDITALAGKTAMARDVQFYLQRVGGTNPIVTTTHARILNGAVSVARSSTATLAAGLTYGVGLRMTLVRQATVSTFTVTLVLFLTLDDGGVTRAVEQETIGLTFTY
jgi:hypothetical protein